MGRVQTHLDTQTEDSPSNAPLYWMSFLRQECREILVLSQTWTAHRTAAGSIVPDDPHQAKDMFRTGLGISKSRVYTKISLFRHKRMSWLKKHSETSPWPELLSPKRIHKNRFSYSLKLGGKKKRTAGLAHSSWPWHSAGVGPTWRLLGSAEHQNPDLLHLKGLDLEDC